MLMDDLGEGGQYRRRMEWAHRCLVHARKRINEKRFENRRTLEDSRFTSSSRSSLLTLAGSCTAGARLGHRGIFLHVSGAGGVWPLSAAVSKQSDTVNSSTPYAYRGRSKVKIEPRWSPDFWSICKQLQSTTISRVHYVKYRFEPINIEQRSWSAHRSVLAIPSTSHHTNT